MALRACFGLFSLLLLGQIQADDLTGAQFQKIGLLAINHNMHPHLIYLNMSATKHVDIIHSMVPKVSLSLRKHS